MGFLLAFCVSIPKIKTNLLKNQQQIPLNKWAFFDYNRLVILCHFNHNKLEWQSQIIILKN